MKKETLRSQLSMALGAQEGILLEPHRMIVNPPAYRAKDGIAWDGWAIRPSAGNSRRVRVFSFDTMARLVKYGFDVKGSTDRPGDLELVAKE